MHPSSGNFGFMYFTILSTVTVKLIKGVTSSVAVKYCTI